MTLGTVDEIERVLVEHFGPDGGLVTPGARGAAAEGKR